RVLSVVRKKASGILSGGVGGANADTLVNPEKMMDAMVYDMPIRSLAMVSNGALTPEKVDGLVDILNGHALRGVHALLKKM
ncbi:MAG: hypothetical protein RSC36_03795, partial [Ruthenibacterium sp.]